MMIGTLTPATTTITSVHKISFTGPNICRASLGTTTPPLYMCKPTTSLYEVLRVNKNASQVEIKNAYRNLAKVYHPDSSHSSDGQDFIKIHDAYSMLSDPPTRTKYDLTLSIRSRSRPVQYTADAGDKYGFYGTRRWETDQCW